MTSLHFDRSEHESRIARARASLKERGLSALLVFASDRTLINATFLAAGITPGPRYRFASLDHAVWLHGAPRFDDWVLYLSRSPVAHAGRGLNHGAMYDTAGRRIASVTQEVLVRELDPGKKAR